MGTTSAQYHHPVRRLIGRRGLGLWALLLAALLGLALVKRHLELLALGEALAAQLTPVAEAGAPELRPDPWADPELDLYLYGDWSGAQSIQASQGPAIFLLNHGYHNPALLRAVLLLEARRCYDWQYTYSRVRNYDLRSGLIRRCLKLYPDDLRVYWAAGQLELAAGDWERAALHLGRVVHDCGSMPGLRDFGDSIGRKGRNILGRYCAALTMCGRDHEAGVLLEDWHRSDESDRDVTWALSHWLLDNGEYQAVIDLLTAPDSLQWPTPTFDAGIVFEAAAYELELRRAATTDQLAAHIESIVAGRPAADAPWPERPLFEARLLRLIDLLIPRLLNEGRWVECEEQGRLAEVYANKNVRERLPDLVFYTTLALGRPLSGFAPQDDCQSNAWYENWYRWRYEGTVPAGELAGFLDRPEAMRLFRSPTFDAALARRGVSFELLKPELYAAIQPQRDNYWDMSNGSLRPGSL